MIFTILATAIGLSICVGLVKLGICYLDSYRILLRSKCFRGPRALPLIGNAHLFMGNAADFHGKVEEVMNKYQSPFRLWLGPQIYFSIQEPEHVQMVLSNPTAMEKSPIYDIFKPLTNNGLLTAPVSIWRPHRKAIQPFFNKNVFPSFIQIFEAKASIMADKIGKENQGKDIDIDRYLVRYTFDSVYETTLGASFNILSDTDSTLFDTLESALQTMIIRVLRPWLLPDFIFKFTFIGQRFYKSIQYIRDFFKTTLIRVQDDIQKEIEKQPEKSLIRLLHGSSKGGYKFTDEEIHDEILTIIGGGFETSTTALSLVLFILASYPDIQDKVYEEVREIYGECKSKGSNITMQDLQRMEYLERVWKEALRLFPIVPVVSRTLSEEINIGEYTLPAGCSIFINLLTIHRSEKYWPKPLEFNPDRFLPMHPLGPHHPYAYIPFSVGARNCIGMKFATVSAKILLATLLSRYVIKTNRPQEAKDIEMKLGIFLRTKHPIVLSVQQRFLQA